MARGNQNINPSLSPEVRMGRMREEMWRLRITIIHLLPERYRDAVNPPYDLSREESQNWRRTVVERVLNLTEPDAMGKAACPLCGAVPQFEGIGYSYPIGLERHLLGSHSSAQCDVIYASIGLQRVRHREKWPGDYGPYGCD